MDKEVYANRLVLVWSHHIKIHYILGIPVIYLFKVWDWRKNALSLFYCKGLYRKHFGKMRVIAMTKICLKITLSLLSEIFVQNSDFCTT